MRNVVERNVPKVDEPAWSEQPIDRLVQHRLAEEGMSPQQPVDRRTLIRRLSLDLTRLPPTRQEIQAFLADEAPGAHERLVDRLLATPQYGEHMAKYWLDLVRFADTNGMHHDHYRQMTPYRDWVIRAFNDNMPYDQFVTYQLAGDLYPDPTREQLIASGFHRLHLINRLLARRQFLKASGIAIDGQPMIGDVDRRFRQFDMLDRLELSGSGKSQTLDISLVDFVIDRLVDAIFGERLT